MASGKNFKIPILYDVYENILNERQKECLSLFYFEDMSLSEISDEIGISRQGVRDNIKRSENTLLEMEEKLKIAKRFENINTSIINIKKLALSINKDILTDIDNKKVLDIIEIIEKLQN